MNDTDADRLAARARRIAQEIDAIQEDAIKVRDQHAARLDALGTMFDVVTRQAAEMATALEDIREVMRLDASTTPRETAQAVRVLVAVR